MEWTLKNSFYYSAFEMFYGWQKIRNEITLSVCIPKINEDIRHTTYELISETYYAAFDNPVFGFILSEYCSLLISIVEQFIRATMMNWKGWKIIWRIYCGKSMDFLHGDYVEQKVSSRILWVSKSWRNLYNTRWDVGVK